MDWINLAQDRDVLDCCEHGDELSGCVKCGEFLDEVPRTRCVGGWVGPRAGLDGCEKPRPRTVQPVAFYGINN
jgi:hypothetical protein